MHEEFPRSIMSSILPSIVMWTLVPLLISDHVRCKNINTYAGPFIAYVHSATMCPSDRTISHFVRFSHFNPVRPFDLQKMWGNVTFNLNFTDNFWSRIDWALRANNQWKENFYIMDFPKTGCSALRDHIPDLFRTLAKLSGAPTDKRTACVIPAGFYEFINEPVSWLLPPLTVLPYGRYRVRMKSRTDSDSRATSRLCLEVDCEFVPKPHS
ncbi:uncharacterized protein LOC117647935 [Thrips palmi]|uniref:Uncharacterized protein LOC117647935 n=1 Tax=Thrips palmi TaxID=161013 RepID=A0A6P8Z063_THRPL|nr:uncharacterized protein LOC117647935 [Thrips palmi]